jgi:SAM-dependent methyltransferase
MMAPHETVAFQDVDGLVHTGALSGLRCPTCTGHLVELESAARCASCAALYPIEGGVLCTDRTHAFMGEFDARRMMEFVRQARVEGWRRTVRESMAAENPATETILMSPQRGSFIDLLQLPATAKVLDLGAGMGAVSLRLAESFARVYSVDQAFERLAFLQVIADQEDIGSIRTICHRDVFRLPFDTGSLDAVVMVGVFEYFPASYPKLSIAEVQRRALEELHRVLVPGGCLFMATKNRFGWSYWTGAPDNSGVPFGSVLPRRLADSVSRRMHGKPFRIVTDSHARYASMLEASGFEQPKFHFPVVGYQAPRFWVDLDDAKAVRGAIAEYPGQGMKHLLSALAATGVLRYAVPHYGIVAHKAASTRV